MMRAKRRLPAGKRYFPKDGRRMSTAEYVAAYCRLNSLKGD